MCLELVDTLTVSDQHAIISSGTFSRYFGVPVPDKWANGLSELYLWYSQRKKIFYSWNTTPYQPVA
jgi:hypothetical protein